jgi:hypothetical protein
VLEQSGGSILRADATGVTGCSRFGKGAFVIGAFDQRISLTMPIESGTAGTNADYNGRLPAGGATEFGFQATDAPGTPAPSARRRKALEDPREPAPRHARIFIFALLTGILPTWMRPRRRPARNVWSSSPTPWPPSP